MRRHAWTLLLIGAGLLASGFAAAEEPAKEIEQVVITSAPLRGSPLETAQPVAVLEGEELVRLRAPTLGETLLAQPGMSASWFGSQASRPVIRGVGGERVQIYEDGGDALDVSGLSGDHAVSIEPLIAHGIEIVRGPATLLYGNGASGGLINVLTNRVPERRGQQPLAAALELRADSALEERAAAAALDGSTGAIAWHADFHTRRTKDISIPGFALSRALREEHEAEGETEHVHGILPNSFSEASGGSVGVSYVAANGFVGLAGSHFDTLYGIPGGHDHDDESIGPGAPLGARIDLEQQRVDLKGELTSPAPLIAAARLRATYNDYQHAELEPDGAVGTRFEQTGLETRLTFDHVALAGWRGVFGAHYRDTDLTVTGEEALLPPARTRNLGFFLFEERPFGRLTVELGARVERQRIEPDADVRTYDRDAFSGSAGLLWKLAEPYELVVNTTSTQRHPTATELYASGPHVAAQRFEIGDEHLRTERGTYFDVGLRKSAGSWRGSLTAFLNDYSRYIFAAPVGQHVEDLPLFQYTQADARFTGFELEIEPPARPTRWGLLETRLLADQVRGRLAGGGNLPQIPPWRVGAEISMTGMPFSASLSVMHYGKQNRVAIHERPTDGYTMVDVDFSYALPMRHSHLLMFVRGTNLLDEEARRHTSLLKDLAPLPGRGVALGVRLEL